MTGDEDGAGSCGGPSGWLCALADEIVASAGDLLDGYTEERGELAV